MRKYNILIWCVVSFFTMISCKKSEHSNNEITNPQLLARLDSMLQAIGVNSHTDLLTGKLEGNFSFFANYYPYDANCSTSSIPFRINTQLSGTVSIDTANRYTLIDAGDLYINNIIISPEAGSNNYTVGVFSTTSNELDQIYGHQNRIKLIKNGSTILDATLYIPKNIIMKGIDCNTAMFPNSTLKAGFTIKWNADNQNTNGVIIQLLGRDVNNIERYSYLLVLDNGSFSFNSANLSMYPKEKNSLGIDVTLMRGNFVVLEGFDKRKYNFNFMTTCGYMFKQ